MTVVKDTKPPLALVRLLNPLTKAFIRSPLGRRAPLAILRFSGHRTGRVYETPTAWYQHDGDPVVFTPAPWRANFAGGAPVTATVGGAKRGFVATLVRDPAEVARVLNEIVATGKHGRPAGLKIPDGHVLTEGDVVAVDRAMLRFRPVATA